MNSKVKSCGITGISGYTVEVEVDLSSGLPAFDVVGLPGPAVKESRDRVRAALKNSGFDFPLSRITVNLAPADITKEGPVYDLPILISILAASGQIKHVPETFAFAGELSLSGSLRPVSGILPMAVDAEKSGITHFFVPRENAKEAAVAKDLFVVAVDDVAALTSMLKEPSALSRCMPDISSAGNENIPDFSEVKGQQAAKRALEIAAAGGHNVLMIGPPGSGKSMLAKRLPGILPPLSFEEQLQISKVYSICGLLKGALINKRPFRTPHHTISMAGLTGGGSNPKPGEVSLAHGGVLFMDELPEFTRSALETLRQPLEDGSVTISRIKGSFTYPSSITLVAAMNPCRCGFYGHPTRTCSCTPLQIDSYLKKISGPLLDRIDLHIDVPSVSSNELYDGQIGERSAEIRERVVAARALQLERFRASGIFCNSQMERSHITEFCILSQEASTILKAGYERLSLSARAHDRILKVARTIADLAGERTIAADHIAEALRYRSIDKKYFERY